MRLAVQAQPVLRGLSAAASAMDTTLGLVPSRKKCQTGRAVCKRGRNVLATEDATICERVTHTSCSDAKNLAAGNLMANCNALGGVVTHSGAACTVGGNCRVAADC